MTQSLGGKKKEAHCRLSLDKQDLNILYKTNFT